MTPREASAGIGQRVTDTEGTEIGTLRSVEPKRGKNGTYHVGIVTFPRETRPVWLKKLVWTDGLRTPRTLQIPYAEMIEFFASCNWGGNSKLLEPIS